MSNPTPDSTPTPDPKPSDPPNPTPDPKPDSQPRTFTQDELNSHLAAERRKVEDSETMKAGKAAIKRLADLEAAQKTAEERLATERDTEKGRADTYAVKFRTALIKDAFTRAAITKGIPADRIDAAFRVVDASVIQVNEETDTVTGADKAVDTLPDWFRADPTKKPPSPDISAGANGQNQPDPVAREADLRRRYRLNP